MERRSYCFVLLCMTASISVGFARDPRKIVSGQDALAGQLAHQVSLQTKKAHFCGGSIIDETHILTAAHCIYDDDTITPARNIEIVTGIDRTRRRTDNVFRVSEIIPHPNYSFHPDHHNDIAVLELSKPIPFNKFQNKINLPTEDTPEGAEVIMSGWGRLRDHIELIPTNLQKLKGVILSLEQCQARYPDTVDIRQICVERAKGSGICDGDSGGPLTYKNEIIGVASWASGNISGDTCATGEPDVYTRVYYYLSWIKDVLEIY